MTINKRKKNSRCHGKTTHGYGSMKKHRGAGNRGGRGMAGSGKRADQKKPSILKYFGPKYFGKYGFHIPQSIKKERNIINIEDLPDKDKINLKEQGYTKLLSRGNPTRKYNITIAACSKKAKEKIEKAGGKVEIIQ